MRNLKRMLCLVLSVVMLVGMMMIGTGAASIDGFGDAAEIEHKDAVALLVELGVINGNNDGNFYPQGTLTREQMAKIAYLVMNVNQNYSMYEGYASTLTDVAGRWSTGAIAWCNANGIIAGGNDGTFSPEGTLTVAQAQTFLLRVLGYDNKLSGLTGTGWDINAGILAQERGLMKGIESLNGSAPITRDQACQMAFNALFITPVEVEKTFNFMTGEMVATGYKTNNGAYTGTTKAEAVFKLDEQTATITKVGADGKAYDDKNNEIEGLTATSDMVGATVTYYVRNEEVVAGATANGSKVIATIGAADWADSKKVGDKGEYIPAGKVDSLKYYVNDASGNFVAGSKTDIVAGSIVKLVNTNDDAKFEVVRIINKKVATLDDDPVVSKDGKKVTVSGVVTDAKIENVKGYEDLKADDVVLYYAMTGVTYIEKAGKTTGKVSSVTNENVYSLGADKLSPSGLSGTDAEKPDGFDFDSEYDFYLDNYNNIVALNKAGAAPTKPVVKYAVVLDFGYKGTVSGEIDAVNNTTYQVKLLLPNGDTTVVEMASVTVSDTKYTPTDKENTLEPGMVDADFDTSAPNNDGGLKAVAVDQLVSYTVKDNKYDITVLGTAQTKSTDLNGGKANFADTLIGNKNTTFLLKVKGEKSYRVVTGVAGLPTSTTGNSNGITKYDVVTNEHDFVTLAYLELDGIDGQSKDQVAYLVDGTKWTETSEGYEIAAIVDGEATTLTVGAEDWAKISEKDGMVTYTSVDGKVTTTDEYTETDVDANGAGLVGDITSVTAGVIKFANGGTEKIYQLADDAVIYVMSKGKAEKVTADKIPTRKDAVTSYNAYIEVEAPGSDMITMIYVLPAAKDTSLKTVDLATGTMDEIEFTEAGTKSSEAAIDYTKVVPGKGSGLSLTLNGQEQFNMDWEYQADGEEKASPAYPNTGKYAIYKVTVPTIDNGDHYKVTKTGWAGHDNSAIDKEMSGTETEFYIIVDSTTTKITIEVGGTTAGEYEASQTYVVNLPGWTK